MVVLSKALVDGHRNKQNFLGVLYWWLSDVWSTLIDERVKTNLVLNVMSWPMFYLHIVAIKPSWSRNWLENDFRLNQHGDKAIAIASYNEHKNWLSCRKNVSPLYIYIDSLSRLCGPSPIVNEEKLTMSGCIFYLRHFDLSRDNVNGGHRYLFS